MSRKLCLTISTLCLVATVLTISTAAYASTRPSNAVDTTFTSSKIYIDGKQVSFDAYLINGNNYLKLRDIAYAMNGSRKQFNVTWDGTKNGIDLIPDMAYTVVGGEMQQSNKVTFASPSTASVFIGASQMPATAYLINGNNYFKLRDIGSMLDFSVEWDGTTQSVKIDSNKPYVEEAKPVVSDNTSEYLTVGEMAKLFIQAIFVNDKSTDYLHYAEIMLANYYFLDSSKYDDMNDMNRMVTRSELARITVIYYFQVHDQDYFVTDVINPFSDLSKTEEATYFYCNAAVKYGLITTPSSDKFNPNGKITEDELFNALSIVKK